ncbi:MAG TPA: hypothetical protein VF202_07400 [Trueperaceae bacterium]
MATKAATRNRASETVKSSASSRFADSIAVKTSPSGTQYVNPLYLLFSREELLNRAREAQKKSK